MTTKKNNQYWRERFELLEDAMNRDITKQMQEIDRIYKRAQSDIDKQIRAWYQRLAKNNEISMADARKLLSADELEEFKWSVEDYIKHGKENALDQRWMKQLENASAKFHISKLEALKLQVQQSIEAVYGNQLDLLDATMRQQYQEGYYHTAFEVQKGFSIGWPIAAIDQAKLDRVIRKPWAPDGTNFSERIWKNRTKLVNEVHNELSRMCITGEAPDRAIKNIAKKMNTSRYNAGRLIMTEAAYFGSISQRDCFDDLGVEQYEICATLDNRTSAICQEMDGKVFDMKDYEAGVTAPPFHVFCRSCTCPYFNDEFTVGEMRAARGADGKTYYVPADMKYPEWKKQFTGGGKPKTEEIKADDIPKMELVKAKIQRYTVNEVEEISTEADRIAAAHTEIKSKWSGNTVVNDGLNMYGKLWNCDITTMQETCGHILLHEHLHARSISYFDKETYSAYQNIEEGTVQLFTQEISKLEGIEIIESQYDDLVDSLRKINRMLKIAKTDYEFAKQLFHTPVTERLNWLDSKVSNSLFENWTINKYKELNQLIKSLY